jgi:hypothetical protein
MPLQAPQAVSALYANLATALFLRVLRQVVDSTVGDVVQLVRTLPCHGRGREFESRRPRHFFSTSYEKRMVSAASFQPELQPRSILSRFLSTFSELDRFQILVLRLNLVLFTE